MASGNSRRLLLSSNTSCGWCLCWALTPSKNAPHPTCSLVSCAEHSFYVKDFLSPDGALYLMTFLRLHGDALLSPLSLTLCARPHTPIALSTPPTSSSTPCKQPSSADALLSLVRLQSSILRSPALWMPYLSHLDLDILLQDARGLSSSYCSSSNTVLWANSPLPPAPSARGAFQCSAPANSFRTGGSKGKGEK